MSGLFLLAAGLSALLGASRQTEVVLGLQGFVLTTVFGKAYSLVPSYFDRQLAWPGALGVHLGLTVLGVGCLALDAAGFGPAIVGTVGAVAWFLGVVSFVATLLVTIRDNPTGRETSTGDAEADRRRTDRYANAFVPVALGYLVVGSYELLGGTVGLPTAFGGLYPRSAHLLAAGFALLMLFAIGYRLLPRFLSVPTPRRFALLVLPLGALGPALIAWGLPVGMTMQVGALAEATAVAGFAVSYILLVSRTDRSRVGFYGPLVGVCFGVVGVGLGVWFALDVPQYALTTAHLRVNVFGLLGLSIVGVVFQFYPPAVGQWPFVGDDLAVLTIAVLAAGVGLAALGAVTVPVVETVGHAVLSIGAAGYVYVLGSVIRTGSNR